MDKDWVLVGSVGKTHGIRGWVKINSFTEPFSNILRYQPWYLNIDKNLVSPTGIKKHQFHAKNLIVQFENCQTPEAARFYTNHEIYVKRDQFLPLAAQEYYLTDLEGLKVYTCKNVFLGIIQTIFATGSNDVIVIKGEKRILIPFLPDHIIKSIDLKQQLMVVDWDPNF